MKIWNIYFPAAVCGKFPGSVHDVHEIMRLGGGNSGISVAAVLKIWCKCQGYK